MKNFSQNHKSVLQGKRAALKEKQKSCINQQNQYHQKIPLSYRFGWFENPTLSSTDFGNCTRMYESTLIPVQYYNAIVFSREAQRGTTYSSVELQCIWKLSWKLIRLFQKTWTFLCSPFHLTKMTVTTSSIHDNPISRDYRSVPTTVPTFSRQKRLLKTTDVTHEDTRFTREVPSLKVY